MTIKIKGELEIDALRGVIYFHEGKTGTTLLRICRLPIPIPKPTPRNGLDITYKAGCSWSATDTE